MHRQIYLRSFRMAALLQCLFVTCLALDLSCGTAKQKVEPAKGVSAEAISNALADPYHDVTTQNSPLAPLLLTLDELGYNVELGVVYFVDPAKDCEDNCYGNNPSTTYASYLFASDSDTNHHMPLAPDDAVLFLGLTPPELHYFGFQTYLFDRKNPLAEGRVNVFASLGDAFNAVTVRSLNRTEQELLEYTPRYNDLTAVVTTASSATAADVRQALVALFGDSTVVDQLSNLEMLPKDALIMGRIWLADRFMSLLRVTPHTEEEDEQAGVDRRGPVLAYMAQPPALALRIRARHSTEDHFSRLQIEETLRARKIGLADDNEEELRLADAGIADSQAMLDYLVAQVEQDYQTTHDSVEHTLFPGYYIDGYACLDRFVEQWRERDQEFPGPWCAGDTRDTAYNIMLQSFVLGADDVVYVIGVNHKTFGMASYMNVSLKDAVASKGLVAAIDFDLFGSAAPYLPWADRGGFYALKIASVCQQDEVGCLTVPVLDDGTKLIIAERAYVNPDTAVGSAYSDLVMPRVLVLKAR